MARLNWMIAATAVAVAMAAAQPAAAVPIDIFSTGVDAFGIPILDGAADPHYTVSPGGSAFAIGAPGGLGWVGNTAFSEWISPNFTGNAGAGPFTYTTTFDLTGHDPLTALLKGTIALDKSGSIVLNGVTVFTSPPASSSPWASFKKFTIASDFVAGINTLEIVVANTAATAPTSTGVQMRIRGRVDVVGNIPEPATIALLGVGLLAFGAVRRRRS